VLFKRRDLVCHWAVGEFRIARSIAKVKFALDKHYGSGVDWKYTKTTQLEGE